MKPDVLIVVRGGAMQEIFSEKPMKARLIDRDNAPIGGDIIADLEAERADIEHITEEARHV